MVEQQSATRWKMDRFVGIILTFSVFSFFGNPADPVIIEGKVSFETFEKMLQIHAEDKTIIDWRSFSIGADETVQFMQPDQNSRVLNRVTGHLSSLIDGTLIANGRLILVNPNGVVIGENGFIQAADFIASTYDLVNKSDWSFQTDRESMRSIDGLGSINMDGIIRMNSMKMVEGQVMLVADEVNIGGSIESPSGSIQVLGNRLTLEKGAGIDVSSPNGGGTILIGADFQNDNPKIGSAKRTIVKEANLYANSSEMGNGGKIIVWGDESVAFWGAAEARGGPKGGDGGLIEISSPNSWIYKGTADLRAENGTFGNLYFDPGDVIIDNFGGLGNSSPAFPTAPGDYNPPVGPGQLDVADLISGLGMGSVTISTTAGAFGVGDITLVTGNLIAWATNSTLRMSADNILSVQGEIECTGSGDILLSSGAGFLVGGNPIDANPKSIITGGNINISAGNGMTVVDGDPSSTVKIETTSAASATNIIVSNGDFSIAASNNLINIGLIGSMSGLLNINVLNGSLAINTSGNGEVRFDSTNFMGISVSNNLTVSTIGDAGFRIDCASTTNNPSFINVGNDFSLIAAGSSDYELGYQFSYLTANIGGNMSMTSSSGADGGIQPLGIGGTFNIGGNLFMNATGAGSVQITSNDDTDFNVDGNISIINSSNATTTIIANGILDIDVGGDLFIENTFSPPTFPGAAIAGVTGIDILSGGSVELGNQGGILVLNGPISVIADQNIILGTNSAIDSFMGMVLSITLVVDNQAPTAPQIGSGFFSMDATAVINTGPIVPIQIFTAIRDQNNISPLAQINGSTFIPGPFGVDTQTEQWSQYFPQGFIGSPFTIFYKESLISASEAAIILSETIQTIGTVFDILEEFTWPLPYYEDLFCISYEGDDFAKGLYSKPIGIQAGIVDERNCPWIQIENYRKHYPSLERWGYIYK